MASKISDILSRTILYCWKKNMNCVFFAEGHNGDNEGICLRFAGRPVRDVTCKYRAYVPKNPQPGTFA